MRRQIVATGIALTLFFGCVHAADDEEKLFATVNGSDISVAVYERAVVSGARNRFYHRTVPEAEMADFRLEMGQRLIEDRLMLEEADRRNVKADEQWVDRQLDQFEKKYAGNEEWEQQRSTLVPEIRQSLVDQSRLRALVTALENIPAPTESELQAFYEANRELFTAPEQVRVRIILLKVDPSAGAAAWQAADAEAGKLVERLRGGASFEELARLHSQDASADKGGDLGYLHKGMLGEVAQKAIDGLGPGQISDGVHLLEGVGVFRLDDRLPPRVSPFDDVRDRVEALWERERRARAVEDARARLVSEAEIRIYDAEFRAWWESPDRKPATSSSRQP